MATRPVYQGHIKPTQAYLGDPVFVQDAAGLWASKMSLKRDVSKVD